MDNVLLSEEILDKLNKALSLRYNMNITYKIYEEYIRKILHINIVIIIILIFGTIFAVCDLFTDAFILPKQYIFNLVACFLLFYIIKKIKYIYIDKLTCLVFICVSYLFLRITVNSFFYNNVALCSLIAFFVIYIYFKTLSSDQSEYVKIVIVLACFFQGCYGFCQYIGFVDSFGIYKITGSFENPAGFAFCLSLSIPFALHLLSRSSGLYKFFIFIVTLGIIIVILITFSRTAILTVLVSMYLFFRQKNSKRLFFIGIVLAVIVCVLFIVKEDSAIGRLFVWNNSVTLINNNFLFGNGKGAFSNQYMLCQANFFNNENDSSEFAQLADNVYHPFNEYLLLIIEYGLVGLILLLGTIFYCYKNSKITDYHLSLLSILLIAFFSYPIKYPIIWVVIAFSISGIAKENEKSDLFCFKWLLLFIVISYSCISVLLMNNLRFELEWAECVKSVDYNYNEKIKNKYDELYGSWNGNIYFLYNYSALLSENREYEKSNLILTEFQNYINDYDVQMLFANNYEKLGDNKQAITHYICAYRMCPNRYIPLYKLLILYDKVGNIAFAKCVAKRICAKRIKVQSNTVLYIKQYALDYLDDKVL